MAAVAVPGASVRYLGSYAVLLKTDFTSIRLNEAKVGRKQLVERSTVQCSAACVSVYECVSVSVCMSECDYECVCVYFQCAIWYNLSLVYF